MSHTDPRRVLALIEQLLDVPRVERLKALEEWLPGEPELRQRVLKAVEDSEANDGMTPVPIAVSFPLPGAIGRYQVQRLIAIGGMGEVFLARDPRLNRDVVIKVIKEGMESAENKERFLREARAAGQLKHANIVTIFDVDEEDGRPFIVMELVSGKTLDEVAASDPQMSLTSKLGIVTELCDGLAYAHSAGVIHRDIKPSNVMIDDHGRVRILDFGIARPVVRDALAPATDTQVVMGTSGYMAPETLLGGQVDARCDMFAAATVAYEFLTLERPFGNGPDLGRRVVLGEIAPMKDVPSTIEAVIRKGLAPKPEDRYTDMTAMRTAVADARMVIDQPPAVAEPVGGSPGRRIQLALGVAAVLALIATTWFYMREPSAPTQAAAPAQSVQSNPLPQGIGSANVQDQAPPGPTAGPSAADAAIAPAPSPNAPQGKADEAPAKPAALPEKTRWIFQIMTIALAVSAGVWLMSSVVGALHRRAYNLTHVESVRSQKLKLPFLNVNHEEQRAAAARGAAYDAELTKRESDETGTSLLVPTAGQWPRRTAATVAVLTVFVTAMTTLQGIHTFQAGAESIGNWDTFKILVAENKMGTLLALAVIAANTALLVKKLQNPSSR